MAKALEDVKVLDFTQVFAGPFGTMMLKDLGADVIKVERPDGGDSVRNMPPFTAGHESGQFININRGKKSITLNIASEKGLQIAKELVKKVDVVVENFRFGVMDRQGLGYEELSKVNPRIIYASSSGFGHTGPFRDRPSLDVIAQSMGGMISINGFPGDPPVKVGVAVGDFLSTFYGTIAILAALHYRTITGEGQEIDISMQDAVWALTTIEHGPTYFLNNEIPPRRGNGYVGASPDLIHETKDGCVIIAGGNNAQFEKLLRIIGREDLIGDERYSTSAGRVNHRAELNDLVREYTRTVTEEEILDKCIKAGVACSPVLSFDQVANNPQLLSREMVVEIEQPISGKVKVAGSVFKMSKTPGDAKLPAPFLGEHNREIYCEMLGYSEQEVRQLADEGVI
ncbi:CaiB/BaiF CoA transferase family protein [Chloroflexota bacterium]